VNLTCTKRGLLDRNVPNGEKKAGMRFRALKKSTWKRGKRNNILNSKPKGGRAKNGFIKTCKERTNYRGKARGNRIKRWPQDDKGRYSWVRLDERCPVITKKKKYSGENKDLVQSWKEKN